MFYYYSIILIFIHFYNESNHMIYVLGLFIILKALKLQSLLNN